MVRYLIFIIMVLWPTWSMAQCRPGDHLIGEDDRAYYCSKRTCRQLKEQLESDKEALRRLQKNIYDTNGELQKWTKENNAAALSAFRRSADLLHNAILGSLTDLTKGKIEAAKNAINERAPYGRTLDRMIERTQELDRRIARLSGIADGLELSQYPFSNLTSAYADLKLWAKDAARESEEITQIFNEMRKDPEGAQILKESGLFFVSDGLKLALKPFAARVLSLGEFFVMYGYDATAWEKSRQLIVQNVENQEKNRVAVCKVSAQLQKTVRDGNICEGRYPAAYSVVPDPEKCK
jgi:DNA repair exonuclease SbcCD ATPase subunit